jgi:transposase
MSAPNPECSGCRALQARVAQLEAQVGLLQSYLAKLEARLNQNSQNSSRPPSSDPPARSTPAPKYPPSGRHPGGQHGHKGTTRFLKPTHECQRVVPFFPDTCAHCLAPLPAAPSLNMPPPRRHQVLDLPPVLIETTEYQCHARACPCCQTLTWAPLPSTVPAGIVGPRLQAVCALLVGRHRVSRRSLQEWLLEVGGEALSLGCLIDLEARTAQALQLPYEQVWEAVQAAAVVNADETPWREGSEKAWLWSAATASLELFRIDRHRSRAAFALLLPPGLRREPSHRDLRSATAAGRAGDRQRACSQSCSSALLELPERSGWRSTSAGGDTVQPCRAFRAPNWA